MRVHSRISSYPQKFYSFGNILNFLGSRTEPFRGFYNILELFRWFYNIQEYSKTFSNTVDVGHSGKIFDIQ